MKAAPVLLIRLRTVAPKKRSDNATTMFERAL